MYPVCHYRHMPRTPSSAAEHIGARIQAFRRNRGFSQDQLAVETGINSANIRSYESGRALTALPTLVRLAEALSVKPESLVEGLTTDMFAPRVRRTSSASARHGGAADEITRSERP